MASIFMTKWTFQAPPLNTLSYYFWTKTNISYKMCYVYIGMIYVMNSAVYMCVYVFVCKHM